MLSFIRKVTIAVSIAALMLLVPGVKTNAAALKSADKKVDITVVIHGKVGDYTVKAIEQIVEDWLEVAHFAVVNADGVDILELEIEISVDDDGSGWQLHTECGEWEEDKEVDVIDSLDDILHEMIEDFIEKFVG